LDDGGVVDAIRYELNQSDQDERAEQASEQHAPPFPRPRVGRGTRAAGAFDVGFLGAVVHHVRQYRWNGLPQEGTMDPFSAR
jgi:hypothetical protein